jgi:hypothetical protein
VQNAVFADNLVLESSSSTWKEAVGNIDTEVAEAKKKFAEAYRIWMNPTTIK